MKDIKNNTEESNAQKPQQEPKPNLFQGHTEAEKGNSKFSEWDIVPPNQFINPRIKKS